MRKSPIVWLNCGFAQSTSFAKKKEHCYRRQSATAAHPWYLIGDSRLFSGMNTQFAESQVRSEKILGFLLPMISDSRRQYALVRNS
uniref:Uncharacterized protein n=1 Tax=Romanomermis culicivorax TaxID=13658 RepID=A0A915KKU1_ROMCU